MTRALSSPQIAEQLVRLTRPQNILYSGVLSIVSYATLVSDWTVQTCVLLYGMLFCLYGLATSMNNYADRTVDRLNNRSDNPLLAHIISPRTIALFVAALTCVLVLCNALLFQPASAALSVIYLLLAYMYSVRPIRLKARGLFGTTCLAICYSVLPILFGALQHASESIERIIFCCATIAVFSTAGLLAKDYKDEVGDKQTGTQTPLVKYSTQKLLAITYGALAIASAAILYAVWHFAVSGWIIAIALIYSYSVFRIHRQKARESYLLLRMSQVCLIAMTWLYFS